MKKSKMLECTSASVALAAPAPDATPRPDNPTNAPYYIVESGGRTKRLHLISTGELARRVGMATVRLGTHTVGQEHFTLLALLLGLYGGSPSSPPWK